MSPGDVATAYPQDQALRLGLRGLAGGTTLYRLLRASKSGQTLDANID